jgi:hypothetical protein
LELGIFIDYCKDYVEIASPYPDAPTSTTYSHIDSSCQPVGADCNEKYPVNTNPDFRLGFVTFNL